MRGRNEECGSQPSGTASFSPTGRSSGVRRRSGRNARSMALQDWPGGSWIGSAALAEVGFGIGEFTFGGLVFAGVLVCTSNPSVNIPYVSLCGLGDLKQNLTREASSSEPK